MSTDPIVIASLNTKGGVGKTSFCHHITAPLRDRGMKVLLIDMDYQGNLSRGLLSPQVVDSNPAELSTSAFFDESLVATPELILTTPLNKKPLKRKEVRDPEDVVHIIPAHKSLGDFMLPRPEQYGEELFQVQTFLEEVKYDFDVVLIDCHPSLELTAFNALIASDFLICPFQPEDYGAQGIAMIQEAMDKVIMNFNPKLRLLGYLLNKVQNNGLHRTFESLLRDYYGNDVLFTVIPQAIQLPEAVSNRMPIGRYKPRIKAAGLLDQLAEEILGKVKEVQSQPPRYYYLGNQVQQTA